VSNPVSIPQLWFVFRKLILIIKECQYSEDNFRRNVWKIVNAGFCISQHGGLGQILQ